MGNYEYSAIGRKGDPNGIALSSFPSLRFGLRDETIRQSSELLDLNRHDITWNQINLLFRRLPQNDSFRRAGQDDVTWNQRHMLYHIYPGDRRNIAPFLPHPIIDYGTWTSRHCWFAPFKSCHCTTFAPSAVDA